MVGNNEEARRERRHALAIQFRNEVATWSAEKLRRAYAQPEAVRAAELNETQAEAIEASRQAARRSSYGNDPRRRNG